MSIAEILKREDDPLAEPGELGQAFISAMNPKLTSGTRMKSPFCRGLGSTSETSGVDIHNRYQDAPPGNREGCFATTETSPQYSAHLLDGSVAPARTDMRAVTLYKIPAPCSLGAEIEVYAIDGCSWFEWRIIEGEGCVRLDTGTEGTGSVRGRQYRSPQIALRDALMVASGLPDLEAGEMYSADERLGESLARPSAKSIDFMEKLGKEDGAVGYDNSGRCVRTVRGGGVEVISNAPRLHSKR